MCLGLSWLSYNLDPLCLVLVLLALVCMRKLLSFVPHCFVKNLELAQCVNHLQDENNKLREVLTWLSSQEPQLGMMIASCKRFDGCVVVFY
jgi:hypothetical protein